MDIKNIFWLPPKISKKLKKFKKVGIGFHGKVLVRF